MRSAVPFLLLGMALAGCVDEPGEYEGPLTGHGFEVPRPFGDNLTAAEIAWPDLQNASLRLLIIDEAPWFSQAASQFSKLTGAAVSKATVKATELNTTHGDLVYGLDTFTLRGAIDEGNLREYRPQLAQRVLPDHRFFDPLGPWHATPTDHDLQGVYVDQTRFNATIDDIYDLRDHASEWGIDDDASTAEMQGLILMAAVRFTEDPGYDHLDFWLELVRGTDNKLGEDDKGTGDEVRRKDDAAVGIGTLRDPADGDLLQDRTNVPLVRTTGILANTGQRAAAEAWIEFTLTDDFQELVAKDGYAVVGPNLLDSHDFLDLSWATLDSDLARWAGCVQMILDEPVVPDC